jgi:hypothetical protein
MRLYLTLLLIRLKINEAERVSLNLKYLRKGFRF